MEIDPLFVDTYRGDLGGRTPELLPKLIAEGPPWHGWWGKVTEGTFYDSGDWIDRAIAAAKATDRLATDWWYGGYLYDHFATPFQQVGDYFLKAAQRAGLDWTPGSGCLNPCIDVESADNQGASAQQVLDHVSSLVEYLRQQTGREIWVYAGSLLLDLQLKTMFGADAVEIARYTAGLPEEVETRIGFNPKKLVMWQYDGDGEGYLAHYPLTSPIGRTDISACVIDGGGQNALTYLGAHC